MPDMPQTDTPARPIPEPRILETACEWTALSSFASRAFHMT